jgi:hypothetical protein
MQFPRSDYISISQPVTIQAAKEVVTLVWQNSKMSIGKFQSGNRVYRPPGYL